MAAAAKEYIGDGAYVEFDTEQEPSDARAELRDLFDSALRSKG